MDTSTRTLIFNEPFDGTSLNTSRWTSCFPGGKCTHEENKELQVYTSNNISVSGGFLKLTAKKENKVVNGKTYNYTSGLIQTHGKFSFTYGYVEARAKTTKGVGFWPTIWTLATDYAWPPELDLLEQVGGVVDSNFMSVHYGPTGVDNYVQQTYTGPDFTAAYHVYGMDWKKDRVDFYIDGKQVCSYINRYNIPSKPMYLLINLAVGGTATPPPNSSTVFPSSFNVDYIKVWR